MKKRILKISAFVVAIVLIVGVACFANALVGNPISKMIAKNTAEKYIEENYSDKDFVIEGVVFNFKFGYYHAYISSPSSIDSSFTLAISLGGKLIQDYYEDRVLSGRNTADRIEQDYRNAVDAVFNSQSFPYREHIGFGDLEFVPGEYKNDPSVPSYAIIMDDLKLDAFYNISELGSKSGKLTIHLEEETVSYERLAAIILEVKKIFDDAGVKFYALDFVLEYPKKENGTRKEGRVEVREFLYSDIYEEGMVERVRSSDEAAKSYYDEQDAEKLKGMIE